MWGGIMTKMQISQKLKKIKDLAERGVGGEKETAMHLYRKLMEKYDIDEAEVLEDQVEVNWFSYSTDLEERLLIRIFYKVTGSPAYHLYTGNYSRRKKRGCECTEIEAVEIKLLFDFYKQQLKEELDIFMLAFLNGNNLYPDKKARLYKEYDQEKPELTDEERRKLKKAAFMGMSMDKKRPPGALLGEMDEE